MLESMIDVLEKQHPMYLPGSHREEKDMLQIIVEKLHLNTRDNNKCMHDVMSYWIVSRRKASNFILCILYWCVSLSVYVSVYVCLYAVCCMCLRCMLYEVCYKCMLYVFIICDMMVYYFSIYCFALIE